MTVAVASFDAVAVRCSEVLETSVFERVVHVIALVVRAIVAIPTVIVHVRKTVHAPPSLRSGSGAARP